MAGQVRSYYLQDNTIRSDVSDFSRLCKFLPSWQTVMFSTKYNHPYLLYD